MPGTPSEAEAANRNVGMEKTSLPSARCMSFPSLHEFRFDSID